nr:UvrABC system protein A [Paraburkholderia busanensis]
MTTQEIADAVKKCVVVRGARQNNLKDLSLDIPRDQIVLFAGISGSGKSSLAFETIFAEAQRRFLDSMSPFERLNLDQVAPPRCDAILGLPPALALRQSRGRPNVRSTLGSISQISDFVRLLFSRAGCYPAGQSMLLASDFSANTPRGACPACHGIGWEYRLSEADMIPDSSLSIRDGAIAGWARAWHGHKFKNILATLGIDIDRPWQDLPDKDRNWILYTDEEPSVPVYGDLQPYEIQKAIADGIPPRYIGTFQSVERYLKKSLASSKRKFAVGLKMTPCHLCDGRKLNRKALGVTFQGLDIASVNAMPLHELARFLSPASIAKNFDEAATGIEKLDAAQRLASEITQRIAALQGLALGYLTLDRSTVTLSGGELQRIQIATHVRSNLFQVLYVLDEPAAGLHPRDIEALMAMLRQMQNAGNSVFLVEHNLQVIRQADWVVEIGPGAGANGGCLVYNGPRARLITCRGSKTAPYLRHASNVRQRPTRTPKSWLRIEGIQANNLKGINVNFPTGVLTAVTGVSGAGKSTLVSHVLFELAIQQLEQQKTDINRADLAEQIEQPGFVVKRSEGFEEFSKVIKVDQQPIGRTARSVVATYVGIFDRIRRLFASAELSRTRGYRASRFSFNGKEGCCPACDGEGYLTVTLHFMPAVLTPCKECDGRRYNRSTLEVQYRGKNVADVLQLTVKEAFDFFEGIDEISQSLRLLETLGLGYLRLGQPAPELSGGEAQRVKLAAELKTLKRTGTLFIFDEPCTGLHPSDADLLMHQLQRLVDQGNTVAMVEHDMRLVSECDWVIDLAPELEGVNIAAEGPPRDVAKSRASATATYLSQYLKE